MKTCDRMPGYTRPSIVGLTGGIAAGKSTVARLFASHGVPIVDADALARHVVQPDSEGLAAVVAAFGPGVLCADGTLDRAGLACRVFGNPDERRQLEAILHPRIARRAFECFEALAAQPQAPVYVLYEAALLIETGAMAFCHALVVVVATPAVQRLRLQARDRLTATQIEQRLAAQHADEAKVARADYVIDNSGTAEQTAAQAWQVHTALLARFEHECNVLKTGDI